MAAALQLASAICRHYWPLALLAANASRPCRRVVLVAAVLDGWWTGSAAGDPPLRMPEPIGLLTYLLLKRLDDLAYGLGLWRAWCGNATRPLKPQIRDLASLTWQAASAQRCADRRCGQRWIVSPNAFRLIQAAW